MNVKAILPLMLFSSIVFAEEYQSISDVDYSRVESELFEFDSLTIGSIWYFDAKETLGPLNEFEYINKSSNVFGSYSRLDAGGGDSDQVSIGGEYFAGNLLLGGSYGKFDDSDAFTGTVGYLFTSNFLVSLEAAKTENLDANYFVSARYNHQLGGSDYLGFDVTTDDEFDTKVVSSRYFTRLVGDNYLAAEVSYAFSDTADDSWALNGDYYFSERTSLGLGIAKNEVYSADFTHFFNEEIAVELGYTTSTFDDFGLDPDFDVYRMGMTVQF